MDGTPPIPFHQSYWVVPGKLLAGFYPGHSEPDKATVQLQALVDCGIRYIINLMEPDEVNRAGQPFVPYIDQARALAGEPVGFRRFPIRDVSIPTVETMRAILDAIDAAISAGQLVYVHCWGGKGRTGTVVGCYMARHGIAEGDAALERIIQLRKNILPYHESPETEQQRAFVRAWKQGK